LQKLKSSNSEVTTQSWVSNFLKYRS
jgi:hypothetical protein